MIFSDFKVDLLYKNYLNSVNDGELLKTLSVIE